MNCDTLGGGEDGPRTGLLLGPFEKKGLLDRPCIDAGRRLDLHGSDEVVVWRRDGLDDAADRPATSRDVRIVDEDEVTNLGVALWPDPLLATVEERHVFLDVTFPEEVDEILDLPPTPEVLILLDEDTRRQAFDRIEHQEIVGRD